MGAICNLGHKQINNLAGAKKFLKERFEKKDSVIFLATKKNPKNQIPVGFIQLYPTFSSVSMKRLWILNDLYVDADFRKNGIAKKLMESAQAFAVSTESKGIILHTAKDNFPAQQLYEKLGYIKDKEFTTYYLTLKNFSD